MKAFAVVAYAYDAAMHCPECARQRFGAALDDPATEDSEGNTLGALFAVDVTDEEFCDDCLEVIPGTERDL